jgi:hypothetical protein
MLSVVTGLSVCVLTWFIRQVITAPERDDI